MPPSAGGDDYHTDVPGRSGTASHMHIWRKPSSLQSSAPPLRPHLAQEHLGGCVALSSLIY